jgi:hypothetical protein
MFYFSFSKIRGSFQKFCTLSLFSLKMNLFYKIHLQVFNVISIVLYHSGPTFGKVMYSCLDAFVVDASDYSGHLIRHLLSASEAFPTEWFLQFWEQVIVWWAEPTRLWLVPKKPIRGKSLRCWCVWLHKSPPQWFWSVSHGVVSSILGTSQSLVGWAHQNLTCSQNWRNHSVGNASEALMRCLMRWPE